MSSSCILSNNELSLIPITIQSRIMLLCRVSYSPYCRVQLWTSRLFLHHLVSNVSFPSRNVSQICPLLTGISSCLHLGAWRLEIYRQPHLPSYKLVYSLGSPHFFTNLDACRKCSNHLIQRGHSSVQLKSKGLGGAIWCDEIISTLQTPFKIHNSNKNQIINEISNKTDSTISAYISLQ